MGDLANMMHIKDTPGAARVWDRLDKAAKRFVLDEVRDAAITEQAVKEAVKKWRKQRRKKKQQQ
jgi:hypothetical protein